MRGAGGGGAREDDERELSQCMAKWQGYMGMRTWERDTHELGKFSVGGSVRRPEESH